MSKLNQIIALERGVQKTSGDILTNAYHQIQKPALFEGLSRTYQPRADDGDQLPAESTKMVLHLDTIMDEVASSLVRLIDIVTTKDNTNCVAFADIVIDGQTLAIGVPVTTLIFLEKKLVDIGTFISRLPTLDPTQTWRWDSENDEFRTDPVRTTKTKKVLRNHVKAAATDKHPAQVDVFGEDVIVGDWTLIKMSSAKSQQRIKELAARVGKLSDAVKVAREKANMTSVEDRKIGADLMGYIFGSVLITS